MGVFGQPQRFFLCPGTITLRRSRRVNGASGRLWKTRRISTSNSTEPWHFLDGRLIYGIEICLVNQHISILKYCKPIVRKNIGAHGFSTPKRKKIPGKHGFLMIELGFCRQTVGIPAPPDGATNFEVDECPN